MAQFNITLTKEELHELFLGNSRDDAVAKLLEKIFNEVLLCQSAEQLGAKPYERTDQRIRILTLPEACRKALRQSSRRCFLTVWYLTDLARNLAKQKKLYHSKNEKPSNIKVLRSIIYVKSHCAGLQNHSIPTHSRLF
ncbi:MAG: hypothetical protein PHY77_04200 [Desulfotomaculaceae bacterium]|nr:hypothetical protein [Desulfotomaculaceae bacterium]